MLGDLLLLTSLYAAVTQTFLLRPSPSFGIFGVFVVLTYMSACWLMDLYQPSTFRPDALRTPLDELIDYLKMATSFVKALGLATLLIGTVSFWRTNLYPVEPKALIILGIGAILALSYWRVVFARVFVSQTGKKRVIVVGAGKAAQQLVQRVNQKPQLGYEIGGYVDDDPRLLGAEFEGLRVLGPCSALPRLIRLYDGDMVIQGISGAKTAETAQAMAESLISGIEILPITDFYERHFGVVPIHSINHSWFIYNFSDTHRGLYLQLKRIFDAIGALIGLIVFSPIMLLAVLAIKLDGPGPVFYSQIRVGVRGKHFRIYKFRSMRTDAEVNGAVWAQKDDPRITRIGRFMRKTRIDEFPQLINVLRGDLSLVGPRPERPEFVDQLKEDIPYYGIRHIVKPGLTGWAQVRYAYGASVADALEKLQYDFYYIKNRSIFLDIEIILRTIGVVVMRKGAQ